jgi:hypothetical protein
MEKQKALKRLGYTNEWLDYGIISEESLFEQYNEILNSEDQNAEHYRCGAFAYYMKGKSSLSDSELKSILSLRDNGPDNCNLQPDRIINLIESALLNKSQLNGLSEIPEVNEAPVHKRFIRTLLTAEIEESGIEASFDKIVNTSDSAIHEYILNRDDLEKKHVEWLFESGGNKSIRNRAKQMLNSPKYR